MIIQKMLKRGEVTLSGLQALLGMKYKQYPEGYVTITYDQFATPSESRVAAQCRGVIFDEDYNIVCRPFDRFFNYGESMAAPGGVNWDRAEIFDKLDGSLIKIWWDKKANLWRTATSGRIYAEAQVMDYGITFNDLVYRALNVKSDAEFNALCESLPKDATHIYELTAPESRVVTRYQDTTLWYLASRKNESGEYIKFDGTVIGAKLPRKYDLSSLDACLKAASELKNWEEGYVVYVDGVPTLKIKSPEYVKAHLVKGEDLSVGRICTLIITNELSEYLTYFPDDEHRIKPFVDGLNDFYNMIESDFEKVAHITEQNEFARAVAKHKYNALLFNMKKGISVKESFKQLLDPAQRAIIKKFKRV